MCNTNSKDENCVFDPDGNPRLEGGINKSVMEEMMLPRHLRLRNELESAQNRAFDPGGKSPFDSRATNSEDENRVFDPGGNP
jgi:hypothetical protein